MIWELPTSLEVNGHNRRIRSDFRDILRIVTAFEDPELTPAEKQYVCLYILYPDFDKIPKKDYEAAYKAAIVFIDHGREKKSGTSARTMDWEQDAPILFPAINSAAGFEVRAKKYLHWWTFLGYFMEIKESTYATVLGLRNKKAKGKKLAKEEKEFWTANREICVIKPKLTEEEKQEKERLKAILG